MRRAERRFRAAVRRLERIGALIDALQRELEIIGPSLAQPVAKTTAGAGVVGLIVKAEVLSSALNGFARQLRHNELQQRLPPEGREK